MWKPVVSAVVRYGVVYAVTGVIGVGVLVWRAYQARRRGAPEAGTTATTQTGPAAGPP